MKRFFVFFLILASIPLLAQDAKPADTKGAESTPADAAISEDVYNDQIYKEITVEDFETNPWENKNVSIQVSKEQKAELSVRDTFPAPITSNGQKSKKYIGIKVYGKSGDVAVIKPPKDLFITQHCQSISVWVYGKNFSGDLVLILKDAAGDSKKLVFPDKLNFLGWKKLTVKLSKDVVQEDKFLSQPKKIQILSIQYRPGSGSRLPQWSYIYLDDISAKVREKYIDKQDDNW